MIPQQPAGDTNRDKHVDRPLLQWGLAGASFAAVLACVSRESLSDPLNVAMYCFAVAIPTNVVVGILLLLDKLDFDKYPTMHSIGLFLGPLAAVAGLASLFWHFSSACAVLFLSVVVACSCYWVVSFFSFLFELWFGYGAFKRKSEKGNSGGAKSEL